MNEANSSNQSAPHISDAVPEAVPSKLRPDGTDPVARVGASSAGVSATTFFYRNLPQLDVLFTHVFPSISREPVIRVRFWGCSIGAEPYTLALEYRRRGVTDYRLAIEGVEYDSELVAAAILGEYNERELFGNGWGGMPSEVLKTWFQKRTDGTCLLDRRIRSAVFFSSGDLLAEEAAELPPADVVFAQNVLIHFTPEDALRAAGYLVRQTRPGGVLGLPGINLDVLVEAVRRHGLEPIAEGMTEIHEGWRLRRSNPKTSWGLEPLDRARPDWRIRYCSLFRKP